MGRDAGALAAGGRLMLALVVGVSLGDAVPVWAGGAALVVCVWLDAVAGWWLRRRGTGRTRAREGAELLADFGCFGGLPGAWVMSLAGEVWAVRGAVIVFLAAAAWRLARFHGEGLVEGRYRGLPTTYCGYAVPGLAGLIYGAGWPEAATWCLGLGVLAWAMNSRWIRVPGF